MSRASPSYIPFTTQICRTTQCSVQVTLVYINNMSERQAELMKESQCYLGQYIQIGVVHGREIELLPSTCKYFVVPVIKDDLIKRIRSKFEKPLIYMPRAIIEALGHVRVQLPIRSLAISLAMFKCHIFLVKSCNKDDIKDKIHEMCGSIVERFSDSKQVNVVVVDRGDDRYCSKAFNRQIKVVSPDWIDKSFNYSLSEDSQHFNFDALSILQEHKIKPFYGLNFKINVPMTPQIKKLILNNQGKIIYGNDTCMTHVVTSEENCNQENSGAKLVSLDFLEACSMAGFYMTKKEFCDIKLEKLSQVHLSSARSEESSTPTMPPPSMKPSCLMPPPQVPCHIKQQPDMKDMIMRALNGTQQTQIASTQIARLPEREILIEQHVEPSQHIYWQ